jgi:hypothetical protein
VPLPTFAASALPLASRTNRTVRRLGILGMILCFALGIANIFTFDFVIIIFCALIL